MRVNVYNLKMNDDKLCYIVKEKGTLYGNGTQKLNTPESVSKMMTDIFDLSHQPEEHLYLLCMTNKSRLLGIFEVSHGASNMTVCNPKEIMQRALLCNAAIIILVHNHPSGEPEPSREDQIATRRIYEAAQLMGIPLADHLVIGENGYYSFAESTDILG